MIEPQSYEQLKQEIAARMLEDKGLLDKLRSEIRPLRTESRRIQPRTTTAVSLVGTDGGNNSLQFDPFLVQLIRVVDSSNNEYCLEAITPTTNVLRLSASQFDSDGSPRTALGRMMAYLGVKDLSQISHMIRPSNDSYPASPSWVQVYRELVEWSILFSIIREKDFGTDTLIVFDGLLRSKVFAGDLFKKYLQGLLEGIEQQKRKNRRKIYLAGVAKHSKVLSRYRLAMALEQVLTTNYPAYVQIPRDLEEKSYVWAEYARGDDRVIGGAEANKYVGGKLFFVKFGSGSRDHVWPIDIFLPQVVDAQTVIGYMLADALNGFPVPCYPQCLQKAHENAALVDFDLDILQDQIYDAIRSVLKDEAPSLDAFRLQDADPSQRRYS
ncbi:MAG: hypothetical protein H0X37_03030 [Herpetosiphonaceae bacterium]|nr:hypothetical protein [Herpetosiphonaceae bacterium]